MENELRRMKNEQCRIKCDQTDYISARQKDGNGVYLVLKQLLWLGPSVRDEKFEGEGTGPNRSEGGRHAGGQGGLDLVKAGGGG